MSEYQYVAFRAVDAPVTPKNLEYMHKQSSRATITPWAFDNEYHFGDFHGNASEMLRRGYDFHFHYANYGTRKLMIRLPYGLPDPKATNAYFNVDGFEYIKDPKGPGGNLCLDPYYEEYTDDVFEFEELLDDLISLRDEIQNGDLRPLYLASLIIACDDNHDPESIQEAPVPAGLAKLTSAQEALLELYEVSEHLIAAAAHSSPPLPARNNLDASYAEWLKIQPETKKNGWLVEILEDPKTPTRGRILAEFQQDRPVQSWPISHMNRTVANLLAVETEFEQTANQQLATKMAQKRKNELAKMAADPADVIRQTEELIKQRGVAIYRQIATLLADLREALAGTAQESLPDQQARKLKVSHPTLRTLISELRSQGFNAKHVKSKK